MNQMWHLKMAGNLKNQAMTSDLVLVIQKVRMESMYFYIKVTSEPWQAEVKISIHSVHSLLQKYNNMSADQLEVSSLVLGLLIIIILQHQEFRIHSVSAAQSAFAVILN